LTPKYVIPSPNFKNQSYTEIVRIVNRFSQILRQASVLNFGIRAEGRAEPTALDEVEDLCVVSRDAVLPTPIPVTE